MRWIQPKIRSNSLLLIGSASIAVVDDVLELCRNCVGILRDQRSIAHDCRFSGNHDVQQVSFIFCQLGYMYMYRDSTL